MHHREERERKRSATYWCCLHEWWRSFRRLYLFVRQFTRFLQKARELLGKDEHRRVPHHFSTRRHPPDQKLRGLGGTPCLLPMPAPLLGAFAGVLFWWIVLCAPPAWAQWRTGREAPLGVSRAVTADAFMEILLQHMYDEIRCISTCHAGHTLFLFAGLCASVLYQARVGSVWAAACACSSMVFVSARMLVSSLTSHRYDSRIITDRNFAELLNVRWIGQLRTLSWSMSTNTSSTARQTRRIAL